MKLDDLNRVFAACIRDAQVFERESPNGSLFEVDTLKKENKHWLAIAVGVRDEDEAKKIFPTNPARAERAMIPLGILGGGQASFYFLMRPLNYAIELSSTFLRASHFAPREGIPLVEIREAYFRLSNLPGDENRLNHLRWELDAITPYHEPLETWLHPWARQIQYNPAHAPSHIHFNALPLDAEALGREGPDHSPSELRLAVGIPNPLALVLSIAAWVRR